MLHTWNSHNVTCQIHFNLKSVSWKAGMKASWSPTWNIGEFGAWYTAGSALLLRENWESCNRHLMAQGGSLRPMQVPITSRRKLGFSPRPRLSPPAPAPPLTAALRTAASDLPHLLVPSFLASGQGSKSQFIRGSIPRPPGSRAAGWAACSFTWLSVSVLPGAEGRSAQLTPW